MNHATRALADAPPRPSRPEATPQRRRRAPAVIAPAVGLAAALLAVVVLAITGHGPAASAIPPSKRSPSSRKACVRSPGAPGPP